jgi:hypothetical protein
MRLQEKPLLPLDSSRLNVALDGLFFAIATKVNGLADGRLSQIDNARTAAPTTGTWAQGDFVRNSTPSELGAALSKYVIYGWLCTVGGTPGTFVQCRFLTGN